MLYFYIGLIIITETLAIGLLKKFSLNGNWLYFAGGVVFFGGVAYALSESFKYGQLGIVNSIRAGLSTLIITLIAFIYFQEYLSRIEIIGIIFIIGGVIMIELGQK